MSQATIGILGAYGATGAVVASILARAHGSSLLLGGRDAERLAALRSSLPGQARTITVDVFDEQALAEFCSACQVVVHCAGPTAAIGGRVAQAALRSGCHYVDLGIERDPYQAIAADEKSIVERGLVFLFGVGYVPGLSELLVRDVYDRARRQWPSVEAVRAYVIDRNAWSDTGVTDIVERFCFASPQIGSYRHGAWRSALPALAWTSYDFPDGFGKESLLPVEWFELERFAEKHGLPSLGVYLPISLRLLTLARWVGLTMKKRKAEATRTMKVALEREASRRGGGGMLVVEAVRERGKGGDRLARSIAVAPDRNYWVTGAVAAVAARRLVDGEVQERGCRFLCDVLEPGSFLDELRTASGIEVRDLC